jgi:hypothetical protein
VAIASLFIGCGNSIKRRANSRQNRKEQIAIASKIQEKCENICKEAISQKRRYTCYP